VTRVETDRTLLRDVLRDETFAGGAVTTRWLEEEALADASPA
jgi:hypothetical protein